MKQTMDWKAFARDKAPTTAYFGCVTMGIAAGKNSWIILIPGMVIFFGALAWQGWGESGRA